MAILRQFASSPAGKIIQAFLTIVLFIVLVGLLLDWLGISAETLAERNIGRDVLTGVLGIIAFLFAFLGASTAFRLLRKESVDFNILRLIFAELAVFVIAAILAVGLQLGWFAQWGLTIVPG